MASKPAGGPPVPVLADLATGWEVVRSFLVTRQRTFADREALETWQQGALARLLERVCRASRCYRPLAGLPLGELPIWDPVSLDRAFDDVNTAGLRGDDVRASLDAERERGRRAARLGPVVAMRSPGTEGTERLLVATPVERARWAGALLAHALPGSWTRRHRLAVFLPRTSVYATGVASRWLDLSWFDTDVPVSRLARALEACRPTVLLAPPSSLRLIAAAVEDGRLDIAPERVVAWGEVLDPVDEPYLTRVLRQPVHEVYQTVEGLLGRTCAHGTLHLAEDLVVFEREWLDDARRRFVPIVTVLGRTSLPMIRVRVGDVLTERATPCPCGSPLLALGGVEGRLVDRPRLVHRRGDHPVHLDLELVRQSVVGASPYIREYRVRQIAAEEIEVELDVQGADRAEVERSVARSLECLWNLARVRPPQLRFREGRTVPGAFRLRRVRNDVVEIG